MVFIDTPFESISNALEISNGLFVVAGTNSGVNRAANPRFVDAGLWISDNTLLPAEGVFDETHLILLANGLMISTAKAPSSGGWLRRSNQTAVAPAQPSQDRLRLDIWDLQTRTRINSQIIQKFVQIEGIPAHNILVGITARNIYLLTYSQQTVSFVSTKIAFSCHMLFSRKYRMTGFTFQPNGGILITANTQDKTSGIVMHFSKSFKTKWNALNICSGFETVQVQVQHIAATNSQIAFRLVSLTGVIELYLIDTKIFKSFFKVKPITFDDKNISSIVMWPNGRFAVLSESYRRPILNVYNNYEGLWVCEADLRIESKKCKIKLMSDGPDGTPRLLVTDYNALKIFEMKPIAGLNFIVKKTDESVTYGEYILTDKSSREIDNLYTAYDKYKDTGKEIKIYFNFELLSVTSIKFRSLLREFSKYLAKNESATKRSEIWLNAAHVIKSINEYNRKHGFGPEIHIPLPSGETKKYSPRIRSRVSPVDGFRTKCRAYELCATTFEKIDDRFSGLRDDFIKICKNTNKYKKSLHNATTIQTNLRKFAVKQDRIYIRPEAGKSSFETLLNIWLKQDQQHILRRLLDSFHVSDIRGIGIDAGGIRRDFFDNVISEVPKYLSSNDAVSWIPRSGASQSGGSIFSQCFPGKRKVHNISPGSEPECDPTIKKYIFIGELLAFGMINNIKVGIHLSRSILQKILKPNVLVSEYMYFGMEDTPSMQPYILSLLMAKPGPEFDTAREGFGIESDLHNPSFSTETHQTILEHIIESFELKNNKYLDAFISGFNTILPKHILRKAGVHISNLDYLLSKREIDPVLLIQNIERTNQQALELKPEWIVMKSIIKSDKVFYKYIVGSDDEIVNKYKAPNGHALFLTNLLKFWTGLSQYSSSINYRLVILSENMNNAVFHSHTCSTELDVFLRIQNDVTEKIFVCTLLRVITLGIGFDMAGGNDDKPLF